MADLPRLVRPELAFEACGRALEALGIGRQTGGATGTAITAAEEQSAGNR